MKSEVEIKQVLTENKLKATPGRIRMLTLLAEAEQYMSPEDVFNQLRVTIENIGLHTVYRNLDEFEKLGIISKIFHPDRRLYYYYCANCYVPGHHHHFICLSCKRVTALQHCSIKALSKEIETTIKGKILSHVLQVNGLCEHCSE